MKQSKRRQDQSDADADTDGDVDNADGELPLPSAAGERQRQRPDDGWPSLQQPRDRRESSSAAARDQRPLAPNLPTPPAAQLRFLRMLELCSGAGGLSFMEHLSDLPAGGAEIRSTWAVDYCPSAAASCKVNHPDADVCGGMGVR